MTSYEILDLVISIIGLVLSAVIVGITIGKKNNRHQFYPTFTSSDFTNINLGANTVYRQVTSYLYINLQFS